MTYLLRFLLYDSPTRLGYTQLGRDCQVKTKPRFRYGLCYRIGDHEQRPDQWPVYVVANNSQEKQIAYPASPEKSVILIEVFLARLGEWCWFNDIQVRAQVEVE